MASLTVTATQGGVTANGMALQIQVITGARAAASQTGGHNSSSGSGVGTLSVTTTVTGSLVFGAALRASATAPTASSGTTIISSNSDATNILWEGLWKSTSTTGTPGATNFGFTTTFTGGMAGAEILPSGTLAVDGSSPALAFTNGAKNVTTASFTPPAGSLLVALVSSDGGAGVTTMAMSDTLGLTWSLLAIGDASGDGCVTVFVADIPGGGGAGASTLPGAPLQAVPPAVGFPQGFMHPPQYYFQQRIGDTTLVGISDSDFASGSDGGEAVDLVAGIFGDAGVVDPSTGEAAMVQVQDSDTGTGLDTGVVTPQAWAVPVTPRSPGLDSPQGWLNPPMPSWQQLVGDLTTRFAASGSDTGTGADGGESLAVTLSSSDTGTGADGGEAITVTLSSSDTGTGTDAGESITASSSDTDNAGGTDTGLAVPQAWVVQFTPRAPGLATPGQFMSPCLQSWQQQVGDPSLVGLSVTAVSDTDTGSGADGGEAITASLSGAETSSGTDAGESITATQSDAEAGSASDTGVVAPQVWAVQFTPRAPGLVSPYGFMVPGMPSWQQQVGDPRTLAASTDTGTGMDAGESITASLSDTETGSASEAVTSIALTATESCTGSDGGESIAATDTEAGAATDTGVAVPQAWAAPFTPRSPGLDSPQGWLMPPMPSWQQLVGDLVSSFSAGSSDAITGSDDPIDIEDEVLGGLDDEGGECLDSEGPLYVIGLSDTDAGAGTDVEVAVPQVWAAYITIHPPGKASPAAWMKPWTPAYDQSLATASTTPSSADAGSFFDNGESIAATLPGTDAGTGSENAQIGVSGPDSGTGTETDPPLLVAQGSDTATGTDAGESIAASDTEAGAATDTGIATPQAWAVQFTPRAPGLVSPSQFMYPAMPSWQQLVGDTTRLAVADGDLGTGTDGGEFLTVTLSDTDTATGTDSGTQIALASSETVSGTDAGEIIAASDTDAGSGSDAGIATPQAWATYITVRPPGKASPAAWMSPWMSLPDSSVQNTTPFGQDFISGSDGGESLTVTLADSDAVSAADASSLAVTLSGTDSITSSDAITSLQALVPGADTTTATDASSLAAATSDTEGGAGTDTGVAQPNLEAGPFTSRAPGLTGPHGFLLPQPSWQQQVADPSNTGTRAVTGTDTITASDSEAAQVLAADFAVVTAVIGPADIAASVLALDITPVILRADGTVAD